MDVCNDLFIAQQSNYCQFLHNKNLKSSIQHWIFGPKPFLQLVIFSILKCMTTNGVQQSHFLTCMTFPNKKWPLIAHWTQTVMNAWSAWSKSWMEHESWAQDPAEQWVMTIYLQLVVKVPNHQAQVQDLEFLEQWQRAIAALKVYVSSHLGFGIWILQSAIP